MDAPYRHNPRATNDAVSEPRLRQPQGRRQREPSPALREEPDWTCIICLTEQEEMAFCSDPFVHGVCTQCLRRYAEVAAGQQRAALVCPQDGCDIEYSLEAIAPWIGRELTERFTSLAVVREIEAAGLGGMLEYCPRCGAGGVIEPEEHEFVCPNPGCARVFCRECRREAHGSARCRAAGDEQAANRIRVEEAMSNALIRLCPRCRTACIKEEGCNKMTCTTCHTYFCYICRRQVDAGYDHFGEMPGQCPLYDGISVDERHNAEVRAAERDARERYMRDQAPQAGPSGARHAEYPNPVPRPAPGYEQEPAYLPQPADPLRGAWYRLQGAQVPFYPPPGHDEYLFPAYEDQPNLDGGANHWHQHYGAEAGGAHPPRAPLAQQPEWLIEVPAIPVDYPYGRERWALRYYHILAGLPLPTPDTPLPDYCPAGCMCNRDPYCFATYGHFVAPFFRVGG